MGLRRKLVGTFIGHLYEYDDNGDIAGIAEINTDLSNVTTNEAALWLSKGAMILGVLGCGIVASDAFIDGLAGRSVVVDVAVDDAFERYYTLPSKSKTA